MDGVKKKINFDPALLYFSNKTDEEKPKPIPIPTVETYNNTNRKHACLICGKRFFTIGSLNAHTEQHTSDESKSANAEDDNWKYLRTLKKGTQFACIKSDCNFVALDVVESQKHVIVCEGKRLTKENTPTFCEKCENHFSSVIHLKAHAILTHSDGCSDISLNDCPVKQIISDPVCLYVSENTDGENSSKRRTMYPGPDHSTLSKKKLKESELNTNSSTETREKNPTQDDNGRKNEIACDNHENMNGTHSSENGFPTQVEKGGGDEFCIVNSVDNSDSSKQYSRNNEIIPIKSSFVVQKIDDEITVVRSSVHKTTNDETSSNRLKNSPAKEATENLKKDSPLVCNEEESIKGSEKEFPTKSAENLQVELKKNTSRTVQEFQSSNENLLNKIVGNPKRDQNSRDISEKNSAFEPAGNTEKDQTSVEESKNSPTNIPKNSKKVQNRTEKSKKNSPTKSAGSSKENSTEPTEKSEHQSSEESSPTKKVQNPRGRPKKCSPTKVTSNVGQVSEGNSTEFDENSSNQKTKGKSDGIPTDEADVHPSKNQDHTSPRKDSKKVSQLPLTKETASSSMEKSVNNSRNLANSEKSLNSTSDDYQSSIPYAPTLAEKTSSEISMQKENTLVYSISESDDSILSTVDEKIKRRRRKKSAVLDVPLVTNLTERSVRSRKKLILPDFEYGFDNKFEKDEPEPSDQVSTSTPKNKSIIGKNTPKRESPSKSDNAVRKRGRPRKSIETEKSKTPTSTTKSIAETEKAETHSTSMEKSIAEVEKTQTPISPTKSIAETEKTRTPTSTGKVVAEIEKTKIPVVRTAEAIAVAEKMKVLDASTSEVVPETEKKKTLPVSVIEAVAETEKVKTLSTSSTKSVAGIGEEMEIFSLTTTISESERDVFTNLPSHENDLKSDADESWLKKLDFSGEQSLTDSWNDPPKKKMGRPPKRKKKAPPVIIQKITSSSKEFQGVIMEAKKNAENIPKSDQSQPAVEKRKRGRPKKNSMISTDNESTLDTNVKDTAPVHEDTIKKVVSGDGQKNARRPEKGITKMNVAGNAQNNKVTIEGIDEAKQLDAIINSVVTIKKRGRPSKPKQSTVQLSGSDDFSAATVSCERKFQSDLSPTSDDSEKVLHPSSSTPVASSPKKLQPDICSVKESINHGNDTSQTEKMPKKRGRPKKSIPVERSENSKGATSANETAELNSEPEKAAEATMDETNIKKKREFMEYIRIKEDVEDSDYEQQGKKLGFKSSSVSPPKKRGRPRLEEIVRKRAAAAESAKNDRPYSIYNKYNAASESYRKRRRDPIQTIELLKMKKSKRRKLLDDTKCTESTSASETANDSSALMSDSSVVDDGATLDDGDLPYVVKKNGQKRVKKLNKVKTKKPRDASPPVDEMKEDETKNINPDLYAADMRNRAKYSRVFKKIREVPKHDEYFPDSLVTCGRCKKLMTLRHYYLYHQVSHYFLCWLDGEKELDFAIDTELIRIMQQYVNPDALRKKLIKLHCEQCHKIMKSVVGYVSHIRFCSKMNEEEFLGTCVLCGKKLKPSSLRHHYVKTHSIMVPNVNAKTKDELFLPVPEPLSKNEPGATSSSSSLAKRTQKSYLNFERKGIDKSDIINDEQFWISIKTSYDLYMCMGLSCKHMTLSKDDLKNHILNCHAAFCEFKCMVCPFTTRYESEIIYHTKNACRDFSDAEEKADDELDRTSIEGRRVSNRVKKRKCRYDEEFFDDNERKRTKGDDDFQPSDEDDDDQDFMFDSDEDEDSCRAKSRSSKRKSGLYTAHGTDSCLRVAFMNHNSTRQYDPLNWTVETRQKICNTSPILEELKINLNCWGLTSLFNLPQHVPKQIKSMKVAFDDKTFIDYDLFQSDVVKGVPISFVGGPVWALAWAPLPAHIPEQYLAVAGLQHMNHLIELNASVKFPSLIQIWKYGSLDNISNAIDKPVLDLAIAHTYGAVSCMEWCPSGGFDNHSSTCRLGILAVATSAGCVLVYSVPKIDNEGDSSNRITYPEPDLVLCVTCDNVQCTRVVWLRKKEQGVICGGFSNGTIALWNISSKSSLLRDINKIYPYRTFEAHNASILALDAHWLDNGRYLLTSSIDRVMKYWDLEDLSGPLNEQEGSSPIVNVVWLQQWAVSAVGFDSSNLLDASATISHTRDTIEKKKNIANIRDTCWSIAYSDWNDTVALSLCSGQVSVFAAKHMSVLTFKQPDFEKVVTETSLIPLKNDDADSHEKECVEERTGLPETKTSYDCTSVLQEFGLQFCDRVKSKTPSTKSGFTPECCNVMSINKVCWNQNYNSFNWLAVGYESGFVRVFRVERFDKLHLTKFYKMNENSTVM